MICCFSECSDDDDCSGSSSGGGGGGVGGDCGVVEMEKLGLKAANEQQLITRKRLCLRRLTLEHSQFGC